MAQKHDLTKIGYLLPAPKHADDTQLRELQQFANGVLQANTGNMIESNGYIRRSFHAVFWMYVVLFVVGVGTAVAATVKGYTASTATETVPALVFAGLSAASFFTVFVTRPLESLERNSIFSSWLIAITNSYWTRLMYLSDPQTVDAELKAATEDLVKDLGILADKYAAAYAKYPPLTGVNGGSGKTGGTGSMTGSGETSATTGNQGNAGGTNTE